MVLLAGAGPCAAAAQETDAAHALLAQHPLWQRLLHLPPGGGRSRIDTEAFFLAPDGASDPVLELTASLAALAAERPGQTPFQCRFPARAGYLRSVLPARASAWPAPECPAFEVWRQQLASTRITLVFASAYLNNPSSMFGHTLLRLDGEEAHGSPLLAWAVNFAAQSDGVQDLDFAWKGLTGGFAGRFGLYPYYAKVEEYARIENRDLWEYRLKLAPAEIDRLLAHLWELREAAFDYFFLDENCSFQLLALLDVARPDLDLSAGFGLWVAPVDTIRRLHEKNLVASVDYRPAVHTLLSARIAGLAPALRAQLLHLLQPAAAEPPLPLNLPLRDQIQLAELAHDWTAYQLKNRAWINGVDGLLDSVRLQRLARQMLRWRSRLPAGEAFAEIAAPAAPEQAQAGQRVGLGAGLRRGGSPALQLAWRPVMHDVLDASPGYVDGQGIAVLDVRFSLRQQQLRLQELSLLRIESRSPRDAFFKPWSWILDQGYARNGPDGHGMIFAQGSLGGAWAPAPGVLLWLMGQVRGLLGGALDAERGLAGGLLMGVQGRWGERWDWHIEGRGLGLLMQAGTADERARLKSHLRQLALRQQWQFGAAWGLRMEVARHFAPAGEQLGFTLFHYF